jgi:hypothetical protein
MENEDWKTGLRMQLYNVFKTMQQLSGYSDKQYEEKIKTILSSVHIEGLINQTRQDTLRQVLDNHKVYISDLDETGILVKDIKRKAKELWGIKLNNLNK